MADRQNALTDDRVVAQMGLLAQLHDGARLVRHRGGQELSRDPA